MTMTIEKEKAINIQNNETKPINEKKKLANPIPFKTRPTQGGIMLTTRSFRSISAFEFSMTIENSHLSPDRNNFI